MRVACGEAGAETAGSIQSDSQSIRLDWLSGPCRGKLAVATLRQNSPHPIASQILALQTLTSATRHKIVAPEMLRRKPKG